MDLYIWKFGHAYTEYRGRFICHDATGSHNGLSIEPGGWVLLKGSMLHEHDDRYIVRHWNGHIKGFKALWFVFRRIGLVKFLRAMK